ncbi:MAG: hypothetical protein JXQ90_21680 [Cyclobacteriaceae bacterium]
MPVIDDYIGEEISEYKKYSSDPYSRVREKLREKKSDDFNERIERLALQRSEMLINHSGVEKGIAVLSTILNLANTEIKIVCSGIDGDIKNSFSYLNALNSFIGRGQSLKIILDEYTDSNVSPFLEIIRANKNLGIIQLKKFISGHRFSLDQDNIHFVIGDGDIYRFEEHSSDYRATASFNDSEMVTSLNILFNSAFDNDQVTEEIIF